MSSFLDAFGVSGPNDPNKGGQGKDAIWNGRQWVPFHIASRGSGTTRDLRRSPSVTSPTTGITGVPSKTLTGTPGTTQNPDTYARQNYGMLAGFLNHPEIGPILKQAANEKWDELKLYGRVTQTNFWKSTSAAARTWWQLQNEDPAEARRLVGQTAATIQNRARTLGLNMSAGQIAGLAAQATQNGWTDAQTVDMLMQQVNWATIESGDLTALRDDVKAIGSDYLVAVEDGTAQNYAQKIASGEMSMEGVRSAMLKQAKARFGWMADELDSGITVKQYLQPIRDTIARELEMAPEAVDLTDSKWLKMVETQGEDGKLRAATMNEAMLAARREPQWANTRNAQETSTQMVSTISKMFGRSAV